MKPRFLDYLLSECLLSLILGATGLTLWAGKNLIRAPLGEFAPVGFILLFLLLYGGFTAVVLRFFAKVFPLREGDYTVDDVPFTLWKVTHVIEELGKMSVSVFFPVFFRPALYALFGMKVGKGVAVSCTILDPQLTILEDGCVLGEGCVVTSHAWAQGRFIIGRVRVGREAVIGIGTMVMPGVSVGANAIVLPGSVLTRNTVVPPGETWGGTPAVRVKPAPNLGKTPTIKKADDFSLPTQGWIKRTFFLRDVYTKIQIEAPPSAVWQALMDMPAYQRWNPFLGYGGGEVALGATLKLIVKLPGAWDTPTQVRVTSIDKERELGWLGHFLNIPHLIDGLHSFELHACGDRWTTLIQKEQFEGLLLPFFFGWFTQKKIKKGMELMNHALKQWVESMNRNTPIGTGVPSARS